jgi:hypothetical protein
MSKLIRITVLASLVAGSSLAFAKGGTAPVQNHHCKLPDGSMDMKKTHKECTAAKGTWAKDEPAAKDAPKDAAKDAPKDPPKDAAKPAPAPAPAKKP